MNLTDDDIKEFIEIWKAEFRETIGEGDAKIVANNLLKLFVMLGSDEDTQKPTAKQLVRTMQDVRKPKLKG